jgi:hypothetical protein
MAALNCRKRVHRRAGVYEHNGRRGSVFATYRDFYGNFGANLVV